MNLLSSRQLSKNIVVSQASLMKKSPIGTFWPISFRLQERPNNVECDPEPELGLN